MTISAVDLISGTLTDGCDQSPPLAKSTVLPERELITSIAQQQQRFTALLESAQPHASQLADPQTMLAIQHGIMQAALTVDLAAKMAGSVTQAVNRLVTIQ